MAARESFADERCKAGRRAVTRAQGAVTSIDTRIVPTVYVLAMAALVYGLAALDRELAPVAAFCLLLVAGAVQVAGGFSVGRWSSLALGVIPVLLAAAATGPGSPFFAAVLVLMVFPGTPLIGLGVWARRRHDEARDPSPDAWLYGERAE